MAQLSLESGHDKRFLPLFMAIALAVAVIALDLVQVGFTPALTREGGGIETATAVLYLFCAITFVRLAGPVIARSTWEIPVLFLFMAGRELDFDKRFTSVGILKSRMYLSNEAPLFERLIAVAIIAVLAYALYRLVRAHGKSFINGLRSFAASQWLIASGIALMVGSKAIDGLGRKLLPLGIELEDGTNANLGMIEETAELGIPLLFIAGMCLAVRMFSSGQPE